MHPKNGDHPSVRHGKRYLYLSDSNLQYSPLLPMARPLLSGVRSLLSVRRKSPQRVLSPLRLFVPHGQWQRLVAPSISNRGTSRGSLWFARLRSVGKRCRARYDGGKLSGDTVLLFSHQRRAIKKRDQPSTVPEELPHIRASFHFFRIDFRFRMGFALPLRVGSPSGTVSS